MFSRHGFCHTVGVHPAHRLAALCALVLTPLFAAAADLRVGAAAVDITPPVGIPMAGYYGVRLAEGTHDPLLAKAIVFEQDGAKAAVVAVDLVTIGRAPVEEARRIIASTIKIPANAVMISATHSHTGPLLSGMSERNTAYGGEMDIARTYTRELAGKVAEAVRQADAALAPAKLSTATGNEPSLPHNRRYFMKDGSVGWNPGKLNPNIVKPAGPIDPAVPVVYAETADGQPIATYVNYAMHLDTFGGGMKFSADYAYPLAQLLARVKSPSMLTLFTIGTAGDINHLDFSSGEPQKGESLRLGTVLGAEVIKTYTRLKPVDTAAPRVRSEIVKLALPTFTPADIEKARAFATRISAKRDDPKFMEKVWAFTVLDTYGRNGKPLEVEVQVIALGRDLAWVSLPGEIFVELGLAIKAASPFKQTIIAELANGSVGYIPTKRGYAEGNYEPISSRAAPGSGEILVETALRLLREVHD